MYQCSCFYLKRLLDLDCDKFEYMYSVYIYWTVCCSINLESQFIRKILKFVPLTLYPVLNLAGGED